MKRNSDQATLLCRISSEKQAEGYSLDFQERNGRKYAAAKKIEITKVFRFVESASKDERKKWDEYMAYVKSGPEQHVLISKVDRGSRNIIDLGKLLDVQKIYGKSLHFFDEGIVYDSTSAPPEYMRILMSGMFASYYILDLSSKTKRGLNEKALQGEWPHKAPAGYRNNKETKRLEVNEGLRPWIVRIHELAATGEHSIDSILECLKREGCPKRFPRSNIALILRNPIYTGWYYWPIKDGPFIQGKHEPIVSKKLKDAALAGLERLNKPKYGKFTHQYQGLLVCGDCGCSVVTEIKKKRFPYCHCTWRRDCKNRSYVRQELIDAQFEDIFGRIEMDAPMIEQLVRRFERRSAAMVADQQAKLAQLRQEQGKCEARISNAMDAVADGDQSGDWKKKLREYQARAMAIQAEIAALEKASPASFMAKARTALELSKDLKDKWKRSGMEQRRELVKMVCSNCTLDGEKLSVTYRKPFDMLSEMASCPKERPQRDSNP